MTINDSKAIIAALNRSIEIQKKVEEKNRNKK